MAETVQLIRLARQVSTMKTLLSCYDIFSLTNEINQPWDQPGYILGDFAAFSELEARCQDLIFKKDPSSELISEYVMDTTRLIFFWKKGVENRSLIKLAPFHLT